MGRRQLPRSVLGQTNRRDAQDAPSEILSRSLNSSFLHPKPEIDLLDPNVTMPWDGHAMIEKALQTGTISRVQKQQQLSLPKASNDVAREAAIALKRQGKRNPAGLHGHAENVVSAMKDYFSTRPLEMLISKFRELDTDGSGALSLPEFQKLVRSLQPELTDKDAATVFRMADTNGSGMVEMDEFFLKFRHDAFPRQGCFQPALEPAACRLLSGEPPPH